MTISRPFRLACALVVLLACMVLSAAANAQETPAAPERDERTDLLFRLGLTALAVAERTDNDDERWEMYDKAIEAFRAILVNHPELVRVRLELARTFYLSGQDGLARRNFELVLASGPPPPVAANIHKFLAVMRARKRWSGYFAPPSPRTVTLTLPRRARSSTSTRCSDGFPSGAKATSAPVPASVCRCGGR